MPHAPTPRRSSAALSLALAALVSTAGAVPRASTAAAPSPSAAAAARVCPVEPPPPPLRILHRLSERVVVAKAGESETVEGEGRENQRRTFFEAAESLKGDPGEKNFPVYHWVWPDSPEYAGNIRKGETLLLFLRRATEEEKYGYQVVDIRNGARRLSEADLKVHLERIGELGWLNRQEPPVAAELSEWLVRCAEEPSTRRDGTFELVASRQLAEAEAEARRKAAGLKTDEEEDEDSEESEDSEGEESESSDASGDADAAAAAAASAQPAEESGEAAPADGEAEVTGESAPAEDETVEVVEVVGDADRWALRGTDIGSGVYTGLTPEQRERLASILYGAEKLGEDELSLVPLVEDSDDGRLAPFLVKHLSRLAADPPYETEELMHTIARLLKDRQLRKLAAKYSEDAPYGEYYEPDESEDEESSSSSQGASARAPDAPRLTTAEVRAAMLRAFLAAVEERMKRTGDETAAR